ncbi:MAG TPA: hypothetical protein VI248_27620, partial [Kineosporiaceae bacterium]
MAGRTGRARRPNGVGKDTKPATVRLSSRSWQIAEDAAEALGVTRDAYLDRLLAEERQRLDENGRPMWWTDPAPRDQEVLPLTQSA